MSKPTKWDKVVVSLFSIFLLIHCNIDIVASNLFSVFIDYKFKYFFIETCIFRNAFFFLFQRREICQISSRGTKIDGSSESNYLTAICGQKSLNDGHITVGVCFVDTSMGLVHLSQFEDDKQLSCLETLLAFYPPIGKSDLYLPKKSRNGRCTYLPK